MCLTKGKDSFVFLRSTSLPAEAQRFERSSVVLHISRRCRSAQNKFQTCSVCGCFVHIHMLFEQTSTLTEGVCRWDSYACCDAHRLATFNDSVVFLLPRTSKRGEKLGCRRALAHSVICKLFTTGTRYRSGLRKPKTVESSSSNWHTGHWSYTIYFVLFERERWRFRGGRPISLSEMKKNGVRDNEREGLLLATSLVGDVATSNQVAELFLSCHDKKMLDRLAVPCFFTWGDLWTLIGCAVG